MINKINEIEQKIINGTARVEGKTRDGQWWPDGEHYWIITDLKTGSTHYVPVDKYPDWDKYMEKE